MHPLFVLASAALAAIAAVEPVAQPQSQPPVRWLQAVVGDDSFSGRELVAGALMTCDGTYRTYDPQTAKVIAPPCPDPLKRRQVQNGRVPTVVVPATLGAADGLLVNDPTTKKSLLKLNPGVQNSETQNTSLRVIDLSSGKPLSESQVKALTTRKKIDVYSWTQIRNG